MSDADSQDFTNWDVMHERDSSFDALGPIRRRPKKINAVLKSCRDITASVSRKRLRNAMERNAIN